MTDERIVCADPEALAERGASWLVDTVLRMDAPVVRLALSGGSTPQRLYQRLAEPPHRDHMPWDRLAVFWGDERAVPADDEASNHRMAKEALLDRVSARAVHRIEAERPDAARRLVELLRTVMVRHTVKGALGLALPEPVREEPVLVMTADEKLAYNTIVSFMRANLLLTSMEYARTAVGVTLDGKTRT